jgi:hypothetical protein
MRLERIFMRPSRRTVAISYLLANDDGDKRVLVVSAPPPATSCGSGLRPPGVRLQAQSNSHLWSQIFYACRSSLEEARLRFLFRHRFLKLLKRFLIATLSRSFRENWICRIANRERC